MTRQTLPSYTDKGLILVVDDEEPTRRTLAEILRLEGFQVQTAVDGRAAIEAIAATDFDVLLLDLKMPGIDGLEVLRQAAMTAPETQVILLTAHGSMESAIEALHQGAHDYLLKPASPEQLIRSVTDGMLKRDAIHRRRALLKQQLAANPLSSSIKALRTERTDRTMFYTHVDLGYGCSVDYERRELHFKGEKTPLSPAESRLLKVLVENPGRVLSCRELVAQVQGYETSEWEAAEIIRPLISRLRAKLPRHPHRITNVRGKGYSYKLE